MATKRRRITKEERAKRDQLMGCVEMSHIILLRKLITRGWTDDQIGKVYGPAFRACAELHLDGTHMWAEEVAEEVYSRLGLMLQEN